MRKIYQYKSPDGITPVWRFIEESEPKIRHKIKSLLLLISTDTDKFKMPHIKAFRVEKFKGLFELRMRINKMVRLIFYLNEEGEVVLLHAFVKKHERATMAALEIAKSRIAEIENGSATIIRLERMV